MRKRIVVLPDSHSKPFWYKEKNVDGKVNNLLLPMHIANRRYDWLACFIIDQIKDLGPDEDLDIVDGGDFADLKSLSTHDKGKVEAESERIQLDIDYSQDARRRLMIPVQRFLMDLKRMKKRVPRVRFIVHLGNHENRWARYRQNNPLWDTYEAVPDDITRASEYGAQVIPFLVPHEINGVYFCHYWYKKDPQYAIGGQMPARALMMLLMESAVAFHSHEWHIHSQTSILSTKKTMYAGCYYEHEEKYPGPQGHSNIWRGITVMHNVDRGYFEEQKFTLEDLKSWYRTPEQGPARWADVIADRKVS